MQTTLKTGSALEYVGPLPTKILRGVRLLQCGLIVGEPLANVGGFILSQLRRPMDDLNWLSLLPVTANVILLFAVFAISYPSEDYERRPSVQAAAFSLRAAACLALINSLAVAIAMLTGSLYDMTVIWVSRDVIYLAGPAVLFLFLSIRAWEHNGLALGWSMMRFGTAVFVLLGMNALWPRICGLAGLPGFSDTLQSLAFSMLLGGCALLIALLGIRRFGGHFARFLQGQCFNCAYPLHGLAVSRCPECGREFTLQELGIARARPAPRNAIATGEP